MSDETIKMQDDTSPDPADWAIWLYNLSRLVTDFHDAMTSERDPEIAYRMSLDFDAKFRGHVLSLSLRSDSTISCVRWARQEAVIVRANKIVFIHRRFFRKSFDDSRYTYAR